MDKIILRLVRISVQSAAVPTLIALVNLVLNFLVPSTAWWAMENMALAHVYICSLLYTVNTRKNINDGISTVVFLQDMHIPQSHSGPSWRTPSSKDSTDAVKFPKVG